MLECSSLKYIFYITSFTLKDRRGESDIISWLGTVFVLSSLGTFTVIHRKKNFTRNFIFPGFQKKTEFQ